MDSVLGAPIFYRLWGRLRRTGRRRVARELFFMVMVQGRSPGADVDIGAPSKELRR